MPDRWTSRAAARVAGPTGTWAVLSLVVPDESPDDTSASDRSSEPTRTEPNEAVAAAQQNISLPDLRIPPAPKATSDEPSSSDTPDPRPPGVHLPDLRLPPVAKAPHASTEADPRQNAIAAQASARGPATTAGPSTMTSAGTPSGKRPKINRWDRPKPPKDWRWAVGGIGRILIALGLLMFSFVAYQLWGTGIQTAQAQNRLETQFEDAVAGAATSSTEVTTTAVATTIAPATTLAPTDTVPVETAPPTTEAPATTIPLPTLDRPASGAVVAKLDIPGTDISDLFIVEGVSPRNLHDGPGHFPETPFPGQLGNAAIAGHRTTHGAPFLELDKVGVGDAINVTMITGQTYVYIVTGTQVVAPNDYSLVIPTIDPTKATLTLTTCTPAYTANQRLIIHADLDPTQSGQVTEASPPGDIEPTTVIPGDEPTLPSELPSETTVAEPPTSGAATPIVTDPAAVETMPATTDPAPTTTTSDVLSADSEEFFSSGWFSDDGAYGQVALWGLALTILTIGAYLLSRALRRNWVGALLGVAPFVVVLYFWFENVNRMLPPNL